MWIYNHRQARFSRAQRLKQRVPEPEVVLAGNRGKVKSFLKHSVNLRRLWLCLPATSCDFSAVVVTNMHVYTSFSACQLALQSREHRLKHLGLSARTPELPGITVVVCVCKAPALTETMVPLGKTNNFNILCVYPSAHRHHQHIGTTLVYI